MHHKSKGVPRLPRRIFEWYCGSDLAEDLLGDIEEMYFTNLKNMSGFRAKKKYWQQTFSLLFSYAVRSRRSQTQNSSLPFYNIGLFKNYTKMALRNLARQKAFSLINVICLAVGMSVGLMALSAFVDVMEVDEFHHNKENIYRIITRVDDKQNKNTLASSSVPLANQLKYDGSGIEEMVMINRDFGGEVEINRSLIPVFGYYVTDNFFRVFDFELASGNPTTALKNPFSVVITEAAAAKFFGTRDPIGMTFPIKDLGDFIVTGVLKEYPRTHLYFEALVSFSTLESIQNQETLSSLSDWGPRTNFYTYLLLQPGISPDELSTLANNIVTNQFAEHDELKATAELQPLLDIRTT
ncbi:MAG: ABC transporter permease, partial [Cyclobacteriaceae bacterium]